MSANRWGGISDEAAAQIEAALARGNKIEAIKIYREATNCGLKEAKDAVEAVERGAVVGATGDRGGNDFRRGSADGARKRPGSNWLTMVLVLIVVGVILAVVLLAMR